MYLPKQAKIIYVGAGHRGQLRQLLIEMDEMIDSEV